MSEFIIGSGRIGPGTALKRQNPHEPSTTRSRRDSTRILTSARYSCSTFMAALRQDRIDAPWVLDGPARRRRLPGLCRNPAGSDARSRRHRRHGHSGQPQDRCGARRDPGCAGARLLFLPPCSPDPDPIEQAFAKLKHFLRKDQPRSRDDLWKNVGSILEKFTPEECSNYLANSGCAVGQT